MIHAFQLKIEYVKTPNMLRHVSPSRMISNTIHILIPGMWVQIVDEQSVHYSKQCQITSVNDDGTYTVSCVELDGTESSIIVSKTDIVGIHETLVSASDYMVISTNAQNGLESILKSEESALKVILKFEEPILDSDVDMCVSSSSKQMNEHISSGDNEIKNIIEKVAKPEAMKLRNPSEKMGACCYAVQKISLVVDAFLHIPNNPYSNLLDIMKEPKVDLKDLSNVEKMCDLLNGVMQLFTYTGMDPTENLFLKGYKENGQTNFKYYIMRVLYLRYLFQEGTSFDINIFEGKYRDVLRFVVEFKVGHFSSSNLKNSLANALQLTQKDLHLLNPSEQTELLLYLIALDENFVKFLYGNPDVVDDVIYKLKLLEYLSTSSNISRGAINGENSNPVDVEKDRNELYEDILCGYPIAMILSSKANILPIPGDEIIYIDHWFTIEFAGHIWIHMGGNSYKINIYKIKGAWGNGKAFSIKYSTVYLNSMELHQLFTSMMISPQNSFEPVGYFNQDDIFRRAFLDSTNSLQFGRQSLKQVRANITTYITKHGLTAQTMRRVNLKSEIMIEIIQILLELNLIWTPPPENPENTKKGGTKKRNRKITKRAKRSKRTKKSKKSKKSKKLLRINYPI